MGKIIQSMQDGIGCCLPEPAFIGFLHNSAQLAQGTQVLRYPLSLPDSPQGIAQYPSACPAGDTGAAGLIGKKGHEIINDRQQVTLFSDDDDRTG